MQSGEFYRDAAADTRDTDGCLQESESKGERGCAAQAPVAPTTHRRDAEANDQRICGDAMEEVRVAIIPVNRTRRPFVKDD